jgi:hypothetical protein
VQDLLRRIQTGVSRSCEPDDGGSEFTPGGRCVQVHLQRVNSHVEIVVTSDDQLPLFPAASSGGVAIM